MYSSRENGTLREPVLRHVVRIVRRVELLDLSFRIVRDHDLERIRHAHHARHAHVEIVAHRVLERRQLRALRLARHAGRLDERRAGLRASRRDDACR